MSSLELIVLPLLAAVAGLIGSLAPDVYRWLRHRGDQPPAQAGVRVDDVDPVLLSQVHQLSAEWAARRGNPQAAPLAAGYLLDALLDAQQRWDDLS